MTRSVHRMVKRFVTVIRGFRDGVQPHPTRQPNARQALPFSGSRRLVDRGTAPALLRRIDGADGLTTLCNSLEG
jgi:hypothetical protein